MRDGRSQPPDLPREFVWIALTARINRALGTAYSIQEIQMMPSDQLLRLELWLSAYYAG